MLPLKIQQWFSVDAVEYYSGRQIKNMETSIY